MKSQGGNNIDFKGQVLAATDIVELIGQTVALRKVGSRYSGLCPFHNEKTPSFSVNPTEGYFYCFGCKAKGNAIDFVMQRDRIEFLDALKMLGQRAGLEMPRFGISKEKTSERQMLLDAHSAAASYFQQNLTNAETGKAAREYLAKRGFNAESIKNFQIGVAVQAWDGLLRSPLMKKFQPQQLHLGGMAKAREKGGGFYDTFRNRLMFPIRDENGRVIAFGGRVMPGSEDPAKYLNSPETPLFSKSRCVFGLDLAKKRIVESRTVVIVEGYTDVVMAHQFDCTNVVSVLGTALTEQHVALLKRFADRIVFLFDPDAAGDMAAERAVEVAITSAFKEVHIATLPDGEDPDEFLLKHGREGFEKVLKQAPDAFAFRWTQMFAKHSATGGAIDQESAVTEFLRPFDRARLAGTIDPLRWGFILTRLSRLLEMPVEQLNRIFDLRKTAAKMGGKGAGANAAVAPPSAEGQYGGERRAPYGDRRTQYRDGRAPYGGDGNFRGGGTRPASGAAKWGPRNGGNWRERETGSLPPAPPEVVAAARKNILSARSRAERWILGCLLVEPGRWTQMQQFVLLEDFTDPEVRKLAELYWAHQRDEGEPVFAEFLGLLQEPAIAELAVRLVEDVQAFPDLEVSLQGAIDHLTKEKERLQQQKLVAELRRKGVVDPVQGDSEVELLRQLESMKKNQPNPASPNR